MFPHAGFDRVPLPPGAPPGSVSFKVSDRSRCFDGHFPGAPVLPGVVHVAMAVTACAATRTEPVVLHGLRDLRFRRPIGPGDDVVVTLSGDPSSSRVRFEIRRHDESMSDGVLVLEAGGE